MTTFTLKQFEALQSEYKDCQAFQQALSSQNDGFAMETAFKNVFGQAQASFMSEVLESLQEQDALPELQADISRFVSKI